MTNVDDRNGMIMVQNTKAVREDLILCAAAADFKAKVSEESFEGMCLDVNGKEVSVPFIGRFNVSNLLAVYAAAVCMGRGAEDVLVALSTLRPVNGRFETIRSKEGVTAIVDYAHNKLSFEKLFSAMRTEYPGWSYFCRIRLSRRKGI